MDDFIYRRGPAFLAHLLRRLADELVEGAAQWYPSVGVTVPPRTISTMLALDEHKQLGVMELADLLHQSHPLVIGWIKELSRLSLVSSKADPADKRRTLISLTAKGRKELKAIRQALAVMVTASVALMDVAGGESVWRALWAMERDCREQRFVQRLGSSRFDRSERRRHAVT